MLLFTSLLPPVSLTPSFPLSPQETIYPSLCIVPTLHYYFYILFFSHLTFIQAVSNLRVRGSLGQATYLTHYSTSCLRANCIICIYLIISKLFYWSIVIIFKNFWITKSKKLSPCKEGKRFSLSHSLLVSCKETCPVAPRRQVCGPTFGTKKEEIKKLR